MKRPTRAAWRKMLRAYEDGFNALLREDLTDEERRAAYLVYDLLRTRACGGNASAPAVAPEKAQRTQTA